MLQTVGNTVMGSIEGFTQKCAMVCSQQVTNIHSDIHWTFIISLLNCLGQSQKVDQEPAKTVPLGWYDCGDGFYNPDNRVVYDYNIQFLRNAGVLTLRFS